MMLDLNIDNIVNILPIIAPTLVALILLILYLIEHNNYQKLVTGKTTPSLDSAQMKSYNIIHQAIKKSESILGAAELEGVKVAADSKFRTKEMEEKYEAEIKKYLDGLKDLSGKQQSMTEEVLKQRVDDLTARFEQNLNNFFLNTQQQSTAAIQSELQAAKKIVEEYRQKQLTMIDQNIIDLLERTLAIIINKKLPLRDHLDLVYQSLEQAKAEKFLG